MYWDITQCLKWKFITAGILLKSEQGHTVRKMKKDKWIQYILIRAGKKFRNKKKFWYGMPVRFEH
jgi:hypothetical protein